MPAPPAATISIHDTLALLDDPARFNGMAEAVLQDRYALWLGSGISRDRAPPLTGVVKKALIHLQQQVNPANANCKFKETLVQAMQLAGLSRDEWARFDPSQSVDKWADGEAIISRLVNNYARLLDIQVDGKEADYLVWEAIDVVGTYGNPAIQPDTEHLCVAILILEGVSSDIASANWDALIEKAVNELFPSAATLRVCVHPDEVRNPQLRASLYKFHGCAVLAGVDEARYRERLIGRMSQITGWAANPDNAVINGKLIGIATGKPALMLGLSAQDSNIQGVFAEAQAQMPWPWPCNPPACVCSENSLGFDQASLLQHVYRGSYNGANRPGIQASALLPAYAKPLLSALVLYVLAAKLKALISGNASIPPGHTADLNAGVIAVRNAVSDVAATLGHERFILRLIERTKRALQLFRVGEPPPIDSREYEPISIGPVQSLNADADFATSGKQQLAVAIGLIGMGLNLGAWTLAPLAAADPTEAAVRLQSSTGPVKVFFVSNEHARLRLFENDLVKDTDDAVLVHSIKAPTPSTRSPRGTPGRTGRVGLREVSIRDICAGAPPPNELLQLFREELAL